MYMLDERSYIGRGSPRLPENACVLMPVAGDAYYDSEVGQWWDFRDEWSGWTERNPL